MGEADLLERAVSDARACAECGYVLEGLPGKGGYVRCPECGRVQRASVVVREQGIRLLTAVLIAVGPMVVWYGWTLVWWGGHRLMAGRMVCLGFFPAVVLPMAAAIVYVQHRDLAGRGGLAAAGIVLGGWVVNFGIMALVWT